RNWFIIQPSKALSRAGSSRAPPKSNDISSRVSNMREVYLAAQSPAAAADYVRIREQAHARRPLYICTSRMPMRRLHEELYDLRVPPESLARWALETPAPAQEATYAAIAFALQTEYAAAALLPVPTLMINEPGAVDQDGFLRQPRGAVEHFRLRSSRVAAWMELFIFFRERFPAAAAVLGEMKGKRLWIVRHRLVMTATRAVLASRPLLEELERGGFKIDRGRAARGFARRLEEAVGELPGERVVPQAIVERLAGSLDREAAD